ncbi:ComEC/Rec2 family competence protein [uncultured Alistipes sp.]|uniref:ComEC/Rec2 family competence protein n=1 Tax=uncultured Alistipes sp. TaxID=538949 RepID=UPI00266F6D9C|nr:ComEC/Rec2 family competence protein [uncultured Alistipes sp.]
MKSLPMVKALVPFAAGIVLAEYFAVPWWLFAAAFLLCGALALLWRSWAAAVGLLVAAGWGAGQLHAPVRTVPAGVFCEWQVEMEELPSLRSRSVAAAGRVRAWRLPSEETWHPADDRVLLRADSSAMLPDGGTICGMGKIYPLRGGPESYRRLMARRGVAGTLWLSAYEPVERVPGSRPGLHLLAAARMKRVCGDGDAGAVVRAMTAGDRSGIGPELRTAYARSGMSHLLAVSGLHTGLVFLLANWMLRGLALWRRGHLLRDALAVGCVWLYVAAAGFPPSAVRAAVMCSLLQLAVASGSEYVALNALAAAALGMLLWNPAWIGDIGFQLSFVAVAAILAWAVPMCRRLRTGRRAVDALSGILVVGLAASVATAPLVSHAFGIVPVAGLLLNPAVVPLAGVVVCCGVLGLLVPGVPAVGEAAAWALNALARGVASLSGGAVEYTLSAGGTAVCYLLFAGATAAWWCKPKKSVHLPV